MSGISISIGASQHKTTEPARPGITAVALPVLGALTVGQTPADGFTAGTYASTAGTISSQTAEASINGGAYDPANMSVTLGGTDVVAVREVVVDSAAKTRTFSAGSVTVPAIAPVVTVALASAAYYDGQTVDISDVDATITDPGSPALTLGDLTLILEVDGSAASTPHTAVLGETLTPRVTASHVTGSIDVSGASIVVQAAWDLTAGGGSVTINAMPSPPAAPTIASVGDGSVTLA